MFRRAFAVLLFAILVAGCAGENSKEHYSITTTTLHHFQPGDYIDYQVVGDRVSADGTVATVSGEVRVSYQAAALAGAPVSDQSFLEETTVLSLSDGAEQRQTRYVAQDEDGNVRIYAVNDDNDIYWLSDDGSNFGLVTLFAPLDSTTPETGGSAGLMDCSGGCSPSFGSITVDLAPGAIDTASTPMGKFDAYKVNRFWNSQLPSGTTELTNATLWIFPPVGVVKFSASTMDGAGTRLEYFASVTSTNIDLPEPNPAQ